MTVVAATADAVIAAREGELTREQTIPLLQEIQAAEGFLSAEAMVAVAEALETPVSRVYGVATFYNQFRFQPLGRYTIQVCRGTACHVRGSLNVLEWVRRHLAIDPGQTTRDGLFSLEVVACLGACGLAPVVCINGEFYASATSEKLSRLLAQLRKEATSHA